MQLDLPAADYLRSQFSTTDYNVQTTRNDFWELLETSDLVSTFRAKVPGGWLVMVKMIAPHNRDLSQLGNTTFVADPMHKWHLKAEFK